LEPTTIALGLAKETPLMLLHEHPCEIIPGSRCAPALCSMRNAEQQMCRCPRCGLLRRKNRQSRLPSPIDTVPSKGYARRSNLARERPCSNAVHSPQSSCAGACLPVVTGDSLWRGLRMLGLVDCAPNWSVQIESEVKLGRHPC